MKKRYTIITAAALLGSLLMTNPLQALAQVADGWQMEDGNWYYYQAEKKLENTWIQYNDKWYYLGNDGVMAADTYADGGHYLNRNGEWEKEKDTTLKKNEYEDLSVKAALTGSTETGGTASLLVTLKNEGDRSLIYKDGASPFVIPSALSVDLPGLHQILRKDHSGGTIALETWDILRPGQEITFTIDIRLIQPNEKLSPYNGELHGEYIGEMSWADLKSALPDVKQAEPGVYQGQVRFVYAISAEEEFERGKSTKATGYTTADFEIEVTGRPN